MESTKYLIIGGGLAAARAAEELVKTDPAARGATTLVTPEANLPYHRPPLSKGYLLEEESLADITVHPASWYAENGINVLQGRRARLIDPAGRVCELELNQSVGFEKALIATGCTPVRYDGPGRGLEGLHYLRNVADSGRLQRASDDWTAVVIVGASFMGMELASSFAQKGIRVTVVSRAPEVLDKLMNPDLSHFFQKYFEKKGVSFQLGDEPRGFTGTSRVELVETGSGKRLPCEGAVLCIGARPNTELAAESRLRVENGIVVDEHLETSVPGIFAAGDVASFPDAVSGRRRRIEHWDTASRHGQTAGRNLAGAGEAFHAVPMFFSDVFSLNWELYGDLEQADRVVHRIPPTEEGAFSWYLKDGRIVAAFLMGRGTDESAAVARIIEAGGIVQGKESILTDSSRSLEDLL